MAAPPAGQLGSAHAALQPKALHASAVERAARAADAHATRGLTLQGGYPTLSAQQLDDLLHNAPAGVFGPAYSASYGAPAVSNAYISAPTSRKRVNFVACGELNRMVLICVCTHAKRACGLLVRISAACRFGSSCTWRKRQQGE